MAFSLNAKVVALLGLGLALTTACSDDSGSTQNADDKGNASGGGSGTEGGAAGSANQGDGDGDGDGDTGDNTSLYPTLPSVLPISGCEDLGLGALCSVTQDGDSFTANCAGVLFQGSVTEDATVQMSQTSPTQEGSSAIECAGDWRFGAFKNVTCSRTVTVDTETSEQSCTLLSDATVLPGLGCLELPATFSSLSICSEGAANDGETIELTDCSVIQDECNFQAVCAGGEVLTGAATATGISFSQELIALADAQGETPAFLKGDDVAHSCSATLDGTSLAGSCGAGRAGRTGSNTSVCSVAGTATDLAAQCELLAPTSEHLFVLDSCDALKNGIGNEPGIGEPICALRQNNCVWEVQCGSDNVFAGKLNASASKFEWKLLTGTPCEASFDSEGQLTGKCTVPGEEACELSDMEAVPGGATCTTLPDDSFWARGCGDGGNRRLACSTTLQHGCDFMAACAFAGPLLVQGKLSVSSNGGRNRADFNGLADWECYAEQATSDDVENDNRSEDEWFGDCQSASTGGVCRDTYDADTNPTGFRGLQIFFSEPPAQ